MLKNPLVLCKKIRTSTDKEAENSVTEIVVEKTYKSKIIFNTRPTPKLI